MMREDETINSQTEGINKIALYSVLNAVDLEGGLILVNDLADLTGEISRGGKHLLANYKVAVQECLAHNWIRILTMQNCQKDEKRWRESEYKTWAEFTEYRPGGTDFTQAGWKIYCQLRAANLGLHWQDRYIKTVNIFRPAKGLVSLVSGSEPALLNELDQVQQGNSRLFSVFDINRKQVVETVAKPYKVSPWWAKRFYRLPTAYRVDIKA